MVGMIDLNTTEEDETTPSSGSMSSPSSSSNASALSGSNNLSASGPPSSSSSSSVCLELWHACAGPLISLPKRGSIVVYFPQGHLEQFPDFQLAAYELSPHIFCRVVDVKLQAEAATDEVYAQVLLTPENEGLLEKLEMFNVVLKFYRTQQVEQRLRDGIIDENDEEEDSEATLKSTTPHMFCKTLTASDTSTHGGFSVPRRAAEDCFPPLDYTQQRPSQELVAKDLHGSEWRFRHIYRGQPRRHLLTTGWSAFVNNKKLVSGDAVLFLRGEDGELRLGIRRAAQVKCSPTFPVLSSRQLNHSTPAEVANAVSMRSSFNICYNPRASSSEFVVPLNKFLKSLDHSFSAGMRFKMRFETEDAAERRYTGMITGISDLDPARWPGSKWRCLVVRWDDVESQRHGRLSPWEIEPSGSISSSSSFMASALKRSRSGLTSTNAEFPVPDGIGASDFGESSRFQKVLQGQEILGFNTLYEGIDCQNQHPSDMIKSRFPGSLGSGITAVGNGIRDPIVTSDISCNGKGFSESFRFHKVLQGQEIFPSSPYKRAPNANEALELGCAGIPEGVQMPSSRNGWSALMQGYNIHMRPPAQVSSPSSVLMFQQAGNPVLNPSPYNIHYRDEHGIKRDDQWGMHSFSQSHEQIQHGTSKPFVGQSTLRGGQELLSSCKSSCRLFGFSLTDDRHVASGESSKAPLGSPMNSGSSFLSRVGEPFHPTPPTVNNAVGSNCTNGILHQPEHYLYSRIRFSLLDEIGHG
ncbi:hypothetical protein Tsubulata_035817 [Turnera subulata]|uniref:Auxin response factor n=1 Tax=Turnera subulata TaxID=218843 RepID=A0A9Q0JRT8_9ROSI|nr:hypothetical protein Tsubulata_035817 [Turnera subulata]